MFPYSSVHKLAVIKWYLVFKSILCGKYSVFMKLNYLSIFTRWLLPLDWHIFSALPKSSPFSITLFWSTSLLYMTCMALIGIWVYTCPPHIPTSDLDDLLPHVYFPEFSFCSSLKCHLLCKIFYQMLTPFSLSSNNIPLTTHNLSYVVWGFFFLLSIHALCHLVN